MVTTDGEVNEFHEHLRYLLDIGKLDGAAKGITLQLLEGKHRLNDKQCEVFDHCVRDVYLNKFCRICGGEVPFHDLVAFEEERMCGDCNQSHISFMKHD